MVELNCLKVIISVIDKDSLVCVFSKLIIVVVFFYWGIGLYLIVGYVFIVYVLNYI